MMNPQQELYDALFIRSQDLGFDTYDHLPLEGEPAPYPFVVVGETQTVKSATKTALQAEFYITCHVWGSEEQRLRVSQMMAQLDAAQILHSKHYAFVQQFNDTDQQQLQDTSVKNTVLNHGVITLAFKLA